MNTIFSIESQEDFQKALKEVITDYYSSSNITHTPYDSNVLKAAKDEIKKLLLDSNFDTNKVPELLVDKGWDSEKIAFLVNLLNEKKTELLYASLISQNSEYGETIASIDWHLKFVLGTSELNTFKYPLLQLILSTENSGVHNKIMYDLNKDMLHKTIDALEKLDEM